MSKKKAAKKAVKKTAKKAPAKKAPASSSSSMGGPGDFNWNELLTSDVKEATSFYTKLFGWKTKPFGHGMDYTILVNGSKPAGGLMKAPMPGMPPQWLAYVTVMDIKAAAAKVVKLGGKILVEPFPIPEVGQIAVAVDSLGAAFGLHSPK